MVAAGGALLVTADHGNVEMMADPNSGGAHTAHTRNLVPAVLIDTSGQTTALNDGCLADVAPTLMDLMQLAQPAEMGGRSLLMESGRRRATV